MLDAIRVQNTLGCGFVEPVYQKAMYHELTKAGLRVEAEKGIHVIYDGVNVGEYIPDLLVEGKIIVELKAVKALDDVHRAQCLNYLKATSLQVCLLINFGRPRLQIKRFVGASAVPQPPQSPGTPPDAAA